MAKAAAVATAAAFFAFSSPTLKPLTKTTSESGTGTGTTLPMFPTSSLPKSSFLPKFNFDSALSVPIPKKDAVKEEKDSFFMKEKKLEPKPVERQEVPVKEDPIAIELPKPTQAKNVVESERPVVKDEVKPIPTKEPSEVETIGSFFNKILPSDKGSMEQKAAKATESKIVSEVAKPSRDVGEKLLPNTPAAVVGKGPTSSVKIEEKTPEATKAVDALVKGEDVSKPSLSLTGESLPESIRASGGMAKLSIPEPMKAEIGLTQSASDISDSNPKVPVLKIIQEKEDGVWMKDDKQLNDMTTKILSVDAPEPLKSAEQNIPVTTDLDNKLPRSPTVDNLSPANKADNVEEANGSDLAVIKDSTSSEAMVIEESKPIEAIITKEAEISKEKTPDVVKVEEVKPSSNSIDILSPEPLQPVPKMMAPLPSVEVNEKISESVKTEGMKIPELKPEEGKTLGSASMVGMKEPEVAKTEETNTPKPAVMKEESKLSEPVTTKEEKTSEIVINSKEIKVSPEVVKPEEIKPSGRGVMSILFPKPTAIPFQTVPTGAKPKATTEVPNTDPKSASSSLESFVKKVKVSSRPTEKDESSPPAAGFGLPKFDTIPRKASSKPSTSVPSIADKVDSNLKVGVAALGAATLAGAAIGAVIETTLGEDEDDSKSSQAMQSPYKDQKRKPFSSSPVPKYKINEEISGSKSYTETLSHSSTSSHKNVPKSTDFSGYANSLKATSTTNGHGSKAGTYLDTIKASPESSSKIEKGKGSPSSYLDTIAGKDVSHQRHNPKPQPQQTQPHYPQPPAVVIKEIEEHLAKERAEIEATDQIIASVEEKIKVLVQNNEEDLHLSSSHDSPSFESPNVSVTLPSGDNLSPLAGENTPIESYAPAGNSQGLPRSDPNGFNSPGSFGGASYLDRL